MALDFIFRAAVGAVVLPLLADSVALPEPAALRARFPDADRVVLDQRIQTRYEADGSDETTQEEWEKALTEKGCRALATLAIDYSARYGEAGIAFVEIIGTNGVARAIDISRTLRDATDNSALGMNIVDPLDRTVSCAVPGLKVGETRHVRVWNRARRARMQGAWCDTIPLEKTVPILATTITVDAPEGRPLVHAAVRHPFGATVTREPDRALPGGRRLSTWRVRDVPQLFPEPNMPPLSCCAQTLRLSTIPDWPAVSRWYWGLCAPHLAHVTPAMTNAVRALTADCTTDASRIRALFRFVSQDVRYMGLTLEDTAPGYEPHDVNVTFENRYGVCRDKAALLVALLRVAGLRAYPVLIHAGAKMDPEIPSPYFNHAIVAVEDAAAPNGYALMDPTDESTKDLLPAYLSDRSFLVARPDGAPLLTSPVPGADANALRIDTVGALDADGALQLTTQLAFGGINDTVARHALRKKTPLQRRRWFEDAWRRAVPGIELVSVTVTPDDMNDTETPLSAMTVTRLPGARLAGRTRDALALPLLSQGFGVAGGILDDNFALETRRFPLVLPCTAAAEETLRLSLGANVGAPCDLPSPVQIAATNAYAFTRTVACTNGQLTARRALRIMDVNIAASAYADVRHARQEAACAEREVARFAACGEDLGAHTHVREETMIAHYLSPTAWVETNIVEREILTVRGKQTASELSFGYAPSTRRIALVSATVSNRNGRVFRVAPHEVNVLDCGWAASAPRYPASKLLVANLPGVEIGSVVRTVVARTVTNAPVAETFAYTFGGRDPVDVERLELHVPAGLEPRFDARRVPAATVTTNAAGARTMTWLLRHPTRVPDEPSRAPALFWRPTVAVSFADWRAQGRALLGALAAARRRGDALPATPGDTPAARITAIRTALRGVRTAGPALFELPFDRAFTPPATVLAEGYGSRADRMNLLYALLEQAGFECAFVLTADDAQGFHLDEAERRAVPRPCTFNTLVIRATWRHGLPLLRWLPVWPDDEVFWVGSENEYTPPETSSHFGDSFYDPATDTFGQILPTTNYQLSRDFNTCRMEIRENGAVDFDITNTTYGADVGGLRRAFAEMLPERRQRFHQKLLSALAPNATATGDLETNVKGYPFTMSFRAYAEGFANARGDLLSVAIPDFSSKPFNAEGRIRRTPLAVMGKNEVEDVYEIVFPAGYTEIERLPEAFQIRNPRDPDDVWLRHEVSHRIEGGRLHVTVRRRVARAKAEWFGPSYQALLAEWNRRATADAVRTVVVRR